jgi:tRNA G46 methylase TrmB
MFGRGKKRLSQKKFAQLLKEILEDKTAPRTKTDSTSIFAKPDHREAEYKQTYKAK